MNHYILKTIFATAIFINFSHSQEIIEKKEEIILIKDEIENNEKIEQSTSFKELGKSSMDFVLKNWVKLACPTIGLGIGVSIGAHMADDYGMPVIGLTAITGLATGYIIGKKLTMSVN